MDKVTVKKAQIIEQITGYLITNGMTDIGLRKLAEVAGTSDRMLIYYFETKEALIGQVLQTIAAGFTAQLDALLGQQQRPAHVLRTELLALGSAPQFQVVIQLGVEVVGLAARGQEPFATNAQAIAENWFAWMESRLVEAERNQALALFAEIEGRLMLRVIQWRANQPPQG